MRETATKSVQNRTDSEQKQKGEARRLPAWRRWWFAYVLVPDFRVLSDVGGEEFGAFGGVEVDDLDTGGAEPVQATGEVTGFADDDGAEAELADEATAVPAGGESADHDEVAVGSLASSTAEGVGFAVDRGVVLLDTAVVAGGDELALRAEDGCSDGDAALREAEASF
jgi:hypothetical protein